MKNLSPGAIKKLMMLLADELGLPRYYMLNDDIGAFREFDKCNGGVRNYFNHEKSAARALAFMSVVMENGIAGNDYETASVGASSEKKRLVENKKFTKFNKIIRKFTHEKQSDDATDAANDYLANGKLTELLTILSELNMKKRFLDDQNNVKCSKADKIEFLKMETLLKGPYSKTLSQVSLKNGKRVALDHLEKIKPTTHFVSKQEKWEVVLYNQDAIRGIKLNIYL